MRYIKDRTGEETTNKFGSKMVITNYRNYNDIDVYFPEYNWTKTNVNYGSFKNGIIVSPYEPRTCGVGYLGEGKYKASENGKSTLYYRMWQDMLKRCYNPKYMETRPTYEKCEVCPEWYNFQVFAEWVDKNYYEIEGEQICLDKDILCKGNKIYSPDTCIFVPNRINCLFIKCDGSRGDLPIGVAYHRNKKYRVHCSVSGKLKYLGCYDTPEEAFQVYKKVKEKDIKKVAEEYKNVIPQKLYEAMLRYEVDIDD